tara:strand:+ start:938 stop:1207 length:270 start_codon:yes stop_codon:yes gene_type:complete
MSNKIKTEINLDDGFFIIEKRKWAISPTSFTIYKNRLYPDLTSATRDLLALEQLNDDKKEVVYFLQVASGRPLELTDEVKSNGEDELPF